MKLVAFFFSVYLLALSFVPCADTTKNHDKDKNVTTELVSHLEGSSHSHQDTEDTCSPFCYCACCHIQVSVAEITGVCCETDFNEVFIQETIYLSYYRYLKVDSFLDPPRV